MSLSFSCNVADIATAQLILDPLRSLPSLRQIRLDVGASFCYSPLKRQIEITLQSVATESTMPVSPLPEASFPFWNLPCELRLMVLSHTGLVVDIKVNNGPLVKEHIYGIPLDGNKPPCLWRACCGTCDRAFGCCRCNCCGTYSSSCSCVPVPTALFMTSKKMRAESLQVLYSSNQFIVEGTIREVFLHFSRVPTERLRLLKRLCIDTYWPGLFDQYSHWDRVFDLLQERCIIKILFRSIYTTDDGSLDRVDQLSLRWFYNLVRKFGFGHLLILIRKTGCSHLTTLVSTCLCNECRPVTTFPECENCQIPFSAP
jgi:hypothetical protein